MLELSQRESQRWTFPPWLVDYKIQTIRRHTELPLAGSGTQSSRDNGWRAKVVRFLEPAFASQTAQANTRGEKVSRNKTQ